MSTINKEITLIITIIIIIIIKIIIVIIIRVVAMKIIKIIWASLNTKTMNASKSFVPGPNEEG